MKAGSKAPWYVWDITIGTHAPVTVFAKTFGAACRKAARMRRVTLVTDHDTGGFRNAFGQVREAT